MAPRDPVQDNSARTRQTISWMNNSIPILPVKCPVSWEKSPPSVRRSVRPSILITPPLKPMFLRWERKGFRRRQVKTGVGTRQLDQNSIIVSKRCSARKLLQRPNHFKHVATISPKIWSPVRQVRRLQVVLNQQICFHRYFKNAFKSAYFFVLGNYWLGRSQFQ